MAAPSDAGHWVSLARLVKTQGRRGELAADLLTDIPDRFAALHQVWLRHPDGRHQPFVLAGHWMHQGRVVLHFDGIADMTTAAAWVGAEVQVPRAERAPAPPGRYFRDDLVGCDLYDGARRVGPVTEVESVAGAADLLHVAGESGGECLVPFAAEYLDAVDLDARRIQMRLPAGLLDVNLPNAG